VLFFTTVMLFLSPAAIVTVSCPAVSNSPLLWPWPAAHPQARQVQGLSPGHIQQRYCQQPALLSLPQEFHHSSNWQQVFCRLQRYGVDCWVHSSSCCCSSSSSGGCSSTK
jgi:hypothetical protein